MKKIERNGPIALIRAIMSSPEADGRKNRRKKTSREAQVIRLIALGNTNKEIAHLLSISVKTTEKHRGNAMKRFGLRNTADITRFAVAAKIIEIEPLE
jgi:DNA-binding NarL/FixJ family response regulator